ncbi:hypothetical protein FACS1894211_04610 [Clostridia bacterium]|nr:hypothetical protein FACS1894211_04610 [Clostridia bacterium]
MENETKKETKEKYEPIGFLLFLAFVLTVFTALMFAFYAGAARARRIQDAKRVVSAVFVDIEKANTATVPMNYTYTPWTLVFVFTDADGTVYKGTDRKYDTESLARSHLGETKQIRIDGQGNYLDASVGEAAPDGFLIAGVVCAAAAAASIVLGATPLRRPVRAGVGKFFGKFFGIVAGDKRPTAAICIFIALFVLFCAGTGFFASGLNGIKGVAARREFIETGRRAEATFVCIADDRISPGSGATRTLAGYKFKYEYVDRENGDTVYTGYAGFIPVRASVQELLETHNRYIGAKVEIVVDGRGNSMLAAETAENPIDDADFWVGIGIYGADAALLTVYLWTRFGRIKNKVKAEEAIERRNK